MKKILLLSLLMVSLGVAGYTFYESWRLQDPQYQRERTIGRTGMLETPLEGRRVVDIDRFWAETRPAKEGTREIVGPNPIRFLASIKAVPEAIEVTYVYTALSMMRVDPMPAVNHRMFIETADGSIVPVYVWDDAVEMFRDAGVAPDPIAMTGFHVYTYAKGPAIIVDAVI